VSNVPASSTVSVEGKVLLELVDTEDLDEDETTEVELIEETVDGDVVVVVTEVVERKVTNAAAAIKIMMTITTIATFLVDTTSKVNEMSLFKRIPVFSIQKSERFSS
jgi:hypothetical protein